MDNGRLLQKWIVGCSILIGGIVGIDCPVTAQTTQVASDGTTNTLVNGSLANPCVSGVCLITGGTQVDSSLFHSFEQFSIGAGDEVNFVASGIETLFARVTGAGSVIDGVIRTTTGGETDIFLLNPQGILFGANATLAIDGSFVATTADDIKFNNGALFGVSTTHMTPALLNISIPIGLQYGRAPGAIEVQGPGHQITTNPFTGEFVRTNRPSGLGVDPGQSLLLLGGGIQLTGGNLTAQDGQIELGSLAASQAVSLTEPSPGDWRVVYGEDSGFQDIHLERASSLDSSGEAGGSIRIHGQQLTLAEGSFVAANTQGAGHGGGITVNAEAITIQGTTGSVVSGLYSDAEGLATGQAGNVTVHSQQLSLLGNGKISSVTLGAGQTGNILVRADERLTMQGPTFIVSSVLPFAPGTIGDINVVAGQLTLGDGAQIATSNFGTGSVGELRIEADSILLTGVNTDNPNSPLATGFQALGFLNSGGELIIDAGAIEILEGAKITADTFGSGQGGTIVISAQTLDVIGSNSQVITPSSVSTSVLEGATGEGGDLTLTVDQLRLIDGGQIGVTTFGDGDGGSLNLVADTVELSGLSAAGRSGLFSNAIVGIGNGGDINVVAHRINLQNGAIISASNFQSLNLIAPGQGSPGNVSIDAEHVALNNGGAITADTLVGNQGNLVLLTETLTLQRASRISTNAQGSSTGGNILIDAIALIATDNSDISANAQQGIGGRVTINTDLILGTTFREQLTLASDITASSELGPTFSGTVELNTPRYEVDQGLAVLPQDTINNDQTINRQCTATDDNSFVVSGRGGLETDPRLNLTSDATWNDTRLPNPPSVSQTHTPITQTTSENLQENSLVEAQGIIHENGRTRLVATIIASSPSSAQAVCAD